ncbi:hypothetical protein P4S72_13865 [Vibrio sp. PP-XX7]
MADGKQPDTGTGLSPETKDVNHWTSSGTINAAKGTGTVWDKIALNGR